jgi:hypothetical protein
MDGFLSGGDGFCHVFLDVGVTLHEQAEVAAGNVEDAVDFVFVCIVPAGFFQGCGEAGNAAAEFLNGFGEVSSGIGGEVAGLAKGVFFAAEVFFAELALEYLCVEV